MRSVNITDHNCSTSTTVHFVLSFNALLTSHTLGPPTVGYPHVFSIAGATGPAS